MGGFFRKLFKINENITSDEMETDILNSLTNEILAEEEIFNEQCSAKTNRLPDIPEILDYTKLNSFNHYKFYSSTHPGMIKKSNQDSIFTGEFNCHTDGKELTMALAIIADGMGGLSMGEIASVTAISSISTFMYARIAEYIQHGLPNTETILTHIKSAVQNANKIVFSKGDELGESIGTTLTCVLLIGNIAYFGHVGDCRAYTIDISTRTIEKITRDHSLVGRLVEMGQLTDKEAKSHPRRNEIYRMLGLRTEIDVDSYYRVINDNSVIALVCDGLWEFVDDDIILSEVIQSNDLSDTAKRLIQTANNNGGYDNISVILIKPEK